MNRFSKNLNEAIEWLKNNNLDELVSMCEKAPGDNTKSKEMNIWITILLFFIHCFKLEMDNNESVDDTLDYFDMLFWAIPPKIRTILLPKLNEDALTRGVEISFDISSYPELKTVLKLLPNE